MSEKNGTYTEQYNEKSRYYYANGKQFPLVREPRIFAVCYRPGRTSRDPSFSQRAFQLLHDYSENVGFIPNYNLQLYRTHPGRISPHKNEVDKQNDLLRAVRSLETEPPVDFATVAYRRNPDEATEQVDDLMFVTRQFVVQFKPGIGRDQIDQFNNKFGVRLIEPLGYADNGYLLIAPETEGERGVVVLSNVYYESGLVLFAHPNLVRRRHLRVMPATAKRLVARENSQARKQNERVRATLERADRTQYLLQQWHLQTAKVTNAWNITNGHSSIKIAILDDGVDTGHPEFAGKITDEFDFASGNADGSPNSSFDNHGTACAGVAVAAGVRASGAAPGCSLIAVRYPDFLGVVEEAQMFRWTADHGADVISCSWGPEDGTGAVDPLPDNVRAAVNYCVTQGRNGRGIPIFWAAGNGDESVSNDGYAANPDVIAVAASTSNERRAWYSDRGREVFICAPSSGDSSRGERRIFTVDRRGSHGYNPDPDTGAEHPVGDRDYTDDFGGTSSATPLVAGVSGLMFAINPNLRLEHVKEILRDTAEKIDPSGGNYDSTGHSNLYGFGRVDALRAVTRARDFGTGGGNGGPTSSQPSIEPPPALNRSDPPPTFQINMGERRLYAVEVAIRAELFNSQTHGSQRNADNFYGSWADGLSSSTPFTLPAEVWNRLKSADRLYYRLHVADSSDWTNYAVTVSDSQAASAPSIAITASAGGGPTSSQPSIEPPPALNRSDPPPTFQINMGGRRLYAVEVATRAELFNSQTHGSQRNADNFYGSWTDGLSSSTPFTLPAAVWNRLKSADRLYYRLHVADSSDWTNYAITVSDSQAAGAPSIAITGSAGGGGTGTRRTVTYPSGAGFNVVDAPTDGVDYSDHVGQGAVPLIEVGSRLEERLSSNFQVKELAAADGARYARISVELVAGLQRIRDRVGATVHINSCYRHPALNSSVGGVANSQHIAGQAADIRTGALTPLELARVALEELGCDIGLGLGRNSIHVDFRGQQASWTYEGAELSENQFDQWVMDTCRSLGRRREARQEYPERIGPAINGPERYAAGDEPPMFFVQPGVNRFYAVELTTHFELFLSANEGGRTPDNFFGSWISEGLLEAKGATTYRLPETVWERLRDKERLYYRVVTSSTPVPTWTDVRSSTPESQVEQAPWFEVFGGQEGKLGARPQIGRLDLKRVRQREKARWRRH